MSARKRDEIRAWLVPAPGASLPGIDLDLLDPANPDERGLLIEAQHPEYAAAIDRDEREIEVDGQTVSPGLHLTMHAVVVNQLWDGEPPVTRRTAERLLADGWDHHNVLHMIGSVVTGELWAALHAERLHDPEEYAAALEALPGDWATQPSLGASPVDGDLDLDVEDIDEAAEEHFEETCEWLLDGFGEWLEERGLDDVTWLAHQLVQLKWSYLDGHLGRWRTSDLREVLLELFPRKVTMDEDDTAQVVPAVRQFLNYLDDAELLAPDGHSRRRLEDALTELEAPFIEAMRDPANFGMAKSLFAGMSEAGVDPSDPEALEAWMAEFNALPEEERRRFIPGPGTGTVLTSMALPSREELNVQALASPVLRQVAPFLDWVGEGRALTQKGHLKLADGKELIELLATSDRFDEAIGERTFKTTSTTELPGVDLIYRLALKAGLARKHRGRVLRTKRGSRLADEPLDTWREVVMAMLEIGVVGAGFQDRYGLSWWHPYLDEGAFELMATCAVGEVPLPVEVLAKHAVDGLDDAYDLEQLPEHQRKYLADAVARGAGELVDRLVWLGAATRDGVTVERDDWGVERRGGGELALTDLGRWLVRPALDAKGYEIPVAGALADASVTELLAKVGSWPLEAFHAEVRMWAEGRPGARDELAQAARSAGEPDARALAFEGLAVLGDDAVPAVRAMTDDPDLRPWAMGWLIERGDEQPEAFNQGDIPAVFVQALAVALISGPQSMVAEVLAAGDVPGGEIPVGDQVRMVETLWRVDDPYTVPVLEALAATAAKPVAKAARKALFKHRNRR